MAGEAVDLAEEGTISASHVSTNGISDGSGSALLIDNIKSFALTSMLPGFSSNRSADLYICGYRLCIAFNAASVHSA